MLVPLADLAGRTPHPTAGVTIGELRERLPVSVPGVEPFADAVIF